MTASNTRSRIPQNPYRKTSGRGGGFSRTNMPSSNARMTTGAEPRPVLCPSGPKNTGWDYDIKLKRGLVRHNITRYDLRFKVQSTNTEEESQVSIHRILTDFYNIILQADETTILPPYLELDRNSPGINDLSSSFLVSELGNFTALKNYFSRLYSRNEGGNIYCSLILASSLNTQDLLSAVKYKLAGLGIGLWPRPTDHEQVSDIGWLLYSSRYQDEGRIADMISQELGIIVGVCWRQIRTSDSTKTTQGTADPENAIRALHIEGPSHRIHYIKENLAFWYGASSTKFIDGTKMRLIPPYQSVISAADKGKYGAVVARQSAFLSHLATGTTSEFASNLILDRPHPMLRASLHQVLMEIKSSIYPDFPVFHSIDRTWRSDSSVTFTFLPENESDARMYIAGLVPYLRDT
jgi:hypothetical protein